MTIKEFFKEKEFKGMTSTELVTLAYVAVTTVLTLIFWNKIEGPWDWLQYCPALDGPQNLLFTRALVLLSIATCYGIYRWRPCPATWVLRSVPHLFYLIFWYQEGYQFTRQLPYLDHIFARWDWVLFGCQPSLEFAKAFPNTLFCEYLNLGYYSYYYLMIGVILFIHIFRPKDTQRAVFIFLSSFFLYYLFFYLVPTAGPYYYFHAIGVDTAAQGIYPDLGHYFGSHSEMMHQTVRGPLSQLVVSVEEFGESPMGAFPSSHVSMSTVCMILAWKTRNRWLFWGLMPLFIPLCLATVYIKAHYAVDAIAGFLTAFPMVWLTNWMYEKAKIY